MAKRVVVVPYDEAWKQNFKEIESELAAALGPLAMRIEHVGSTSVPGLSAKPIIDIDVVIEDETVLPDVVEAMAKIGYRHEGNLGIPGREAFKYDAQEKSHLLAHHLYVCTKDASELKRHLSFRDYLLTHPEAVAEYSRTKEQGAALFPDDIDKYIEYKTPITDGEVCQTSIGCGTAYRTEIVVAGGTEHIQMCLSATSVWTSLDGIHQVIIDSFSNIVGIIVVVAEE